MPSRIQDRRHLAKEVSLEARVEALEAQVAALTVEVKARKPAFKDADDYAETKARIAAARNGGGE